MGRGDQTLMLYFDSVTLADLCDQGARSGIPAMEK